MADIIQLLPDHVANQIAAGEVVQRPASVVKELLENSIDAGADQIKLIIKDGGKTLIHVIDNGVGMSTTDARLSFERHATSKINKAQDLFNIKTKGFRGEALASIAAVSHVELKTKLETDDIGTVIFIKGSEVISQEVIVTPKGTSVSVKNLFFNIPARRNFLKSNQVEMRHVIDEFHRVALAHPEIGFSMYQNGSEVFNLPSTNFRKRVVNIFGGKTNEKLVPVNENTDVIEIFGFVYKPEYARKSRGQQFFFVNNRFIKSPYLHHAIVSAFEGLIHEGHFPGYFLNLAVNPESIDINIHPTKTEIKFEDEHTLYAILRSSVKHSLGQFNIAPVLDFDRNSNLETPYNFKDKPTRTPNIEVDKDFNPFREEIQSKKTLKPFQKQSAAGWESLYVGLESKVNTDGLDLESIQFESKEIEQSLFEDEIIEEQKSTFQIQNKYIVSTIKSGILIINQNRAHERILYEQFLTTFTVNENISKELIFPIKLSLSNPDIEIISQLKEQLESTGFVFSGVEDDGVEILGIPLGIDDSKVSEIFDELINDFRNEIPDSNLSTIDLFAKSIAKKLSIKNGQKIEQLEQEYLVNKLFACKEPHLSPTNKSVFITISKNDLDKRFM